MSQFLDEDDAPTAPRPVQAPGAAARPAPNYASGPAAPQRIAAPQRFARQPATPRRALVAERAAPAVTREGSANGNALLTAAGPIFAMVTQIAFSGGHPDTEGLQRSFLAAFTRFEGDAVAAGYREETVTAAKYALATLVDETVLDTGWGFESVWGSRSLLSLLFRETWGGEKVFAILDRLRADPGRNIDMLELIDRCLAFGFQGKYRRIEGGLYQLEDLRSDLYRLCRSLRPPVDTRLAASVTPAKAGTRLRRFLPGWVAFLFAGAVLTGGFFYAKGQLDLRAAGALDSLGRVVGVAGR